MFLGLVVFVLTRKKYLGLAGTYVPNPLEPGEKKKVYTRFGVGAVAIAIIAAIGIQTGLLTMNRFTYIVSFLAIIIPTIYFVVMYRSKKITEDERSRLLAYIPLFIAAMAFWAIQEQGSIVLADYANKRTDLSFMGIEIQSSWFQSLDPLFIIILAPIFASLWMKLGTRQPTTTRKFSFGLIFGGLSFVVMVIPAMMHSGTETLASPLWLLLSFFIVVLGELCLSPVGLSATTKLAPAAFSAQTMSLWFLSNASAQGINAQIVKLFTPETEVAYFGIIGGIVMVLGVILYIIAPKIQRFMKGVN